MENLVLQLPEDMKEFVEEQATAAGLPSPAEFVLKLIRESQRKAAIAYLERLAEESIASGPMTPWTAADKEEILKMLREKYGDRTRTAS